MSFTSLGISQSSSYASAITANLASVHSSIALGPIAEISDAFDLQDINDVHTRLLARTNGLQNDQDRETVHSHIRAFAHQLLLKLKNLKGLGATEEQLRQTGFETLRELEASSIKMIQNFERFQVGTRALEQRFTQFNAKLAAPAFESAFAKASNQNHGNRSTLAGALEKYMTKPNATPPNVLTSVLERVNRMALKPSEDKNDEKKASVKPGALVISSRNSVPTTLMEIEHHQNTLTTMVAARALTPVVEAVNDALATVFEPVNQLAKMSFAGLKIIAPDMKQAFRIVHPVTSHLLSGAYHQAGPLISAAAQSVGTSIADHRKTRQKVEIELNSELGIPAAMTRQFQKDREELTISAVLYTVPIPIMKGLGKAFGKGAVPVLTAHVSTGREIIPRRGIVDLTKRFLREDDGKLKLHHLGQKPKSINSRELIRLVEKHGWVRVQDAGKGDHAKFVKSGADMLIVPVGKSSISKGVLHQIWKALKKATSQTALSKALNLTRQIVRKDDGKILLPRGLERILTLKDRWQVRQISKALSKQITGNQRDGVIDFSTRMERILSRLRDYSAISNKESAERFVVSLPSNGSASLQIRDTRSILPLIAQGRSGSRTYFAGHDNHVPLYVVKSYPALATPNGDFAKEIVAYAILKKMGLIHLSFPRLYKVGKHTIDGGRFEKGLLAMTSVKGESLATIYEKIAKFEPGTIQRAEALSAYEIPMAQSGKALAEIHRKSLQNSSPSSHFIAQDLELIRAIFESVKPALHQLNIPLEVTENQISLMHHGFRGNSGGASLVHGDAHLPNFLWDEATGTLSAIDAGSLTQSLNNSLKPVGAPAKDYFQWHAMLDGYGSRLGLTSKEIDPLKESFDKAYLEEFGSVHTQGSQQFYELYWGLRRLNYIINSKQFSFKEAEGVVRQLNVLAGER